MKARIEAMVIHLNKAEIKEMILNLFHVGANI
jgi:hypothetical protein